MRKRTISTARRISQLPGSFSVEILKWDNILISSNEGLKNFTYFLKSYTSKGLQGNAYQVRAKHLEDVKIVEIHSQSWSVLLKFWDKTSLRVSGSVEIKPSG